MNQEDLTRIKDYCEKATEGPWSFWGGTRTYAINSNRNRVIECDVEERNPNGFTMTGGIVEMADADFIANARTDLPKCVETIKRLRSASLADKAEIERLKGLSKLDRARISILARKGVNVYDEEADLEIHYLNQQEEQFLEQHKDYTASLRAENQRLRALLKKAHDAMFSWHSSEYAAHPLSVEVSKGLYQ